VSTDRDASTMAEQNKKATGVPLANIAVLLAMLGGAALYRFLPLTSPRPGVEPGRLRDASSSPRRSPTS
jgi:hypothetical protein